jgi:hypothetical protein
MIGRLLVAYSNASNFVATTAEYLDCLSRYTEFEVRYVHVTHGATLDFDITQFDAVFQSYCARLPLDGFVSPDFIDKLKSFRGIKVLAVQDEYDDTNKLKAAVREIGYHLMLTNVPQSMLDRIYPQHLFPHTEFVSVLTGYVPEQLAIPGRSIRPLRDRPIHIGYRGRALSPRYGRLGFEKIEIGRRMRLICLERGIPSDIEWHEDRRIYGDAWYTFISSCRAVLGSESGSNIFDFDGEIAARYRDLAAARDGQVPYSDFRVYTDPIEAQYEMGQISPRMFEAAALRTPMILFTGRYSGLIVPGTHYIELKKDFSNVDAVFAQLDDLDGLERMAERTYDRLVGSREFSYRRFAGVIDKAIRRKAREIGVPFRGPRADYLSGNPVFGRSEFATLSEHPTVFPRDCAVFFYKQLAQENVALRKETARLNAELARLDDVYSAEITRLNEVFPAEIARLNEVFPAEISRLNQVYSTEIARLIELLPASRRIGGKFRAQFSNRLGRLRRQGFRAQ